VKRVLRVLHAARAALAAVVLLGAFRAYRLTGQPHLRTFLAGFAILEASYLAVLLNRLVWPIDWGYHTTLWIHELAQLAAFGLLASSYRGRDGGLSPAMARWLPVAAVAAIAVLAAAFLALPQPLAWAGCDATALPIYLLAAVPLGYVLVQAGHGLRARGPGAAWVPAGFAAWGVGQGLWMLWAVTHNWWAALLANVAFVAGLALFAAAMAPLRRRDARP
jgi:hypothetical protein